MTTRGQVQPNAKSRRRRGWLITLAIIVVAIGGYLLYAKLSQPPEAKVLWQHFYSQEEIPGTMQLLPNGCMVSLSGHDMQTRDQFGVELCSIEDPDNRFHKYFWNSRLADNQGHIYFCNDTTLYSYDYTGVKRWEVPLPPCQSENDDRFIVTTAADEGVLISTTDSQIFKFDSDGQLVFGKRSPSKLRFYCHLEELPGGGYALISKAPEDSPAGSDPLYVLGVILDADLNLVWDSSSLGDRIMTSVMFGEQFVMSEYDTHVWAFDEHGTMLWQYRNPDPIIEGRPYHEYHMLPASDRRLMIVSESHVVMVNQQGKILWDVTGKYFGSAVAVSEDIQYVIEYNWSEAREVAGKELWLFVNKHFPSQLSKVPDDNFPPSVVRIDKGRISKRWQIEASSPQIVGPGSDGEFYLFDRGSKGAIVYCVRLD